ncbi:hypothetical protein CRE_07732 [Caenorhabditis remanei]|uniref:Uncharacterized protein n=1 Tax=Caenorhabditis remanei TaxID=31234 RepID=E3MZW2_CAERE|nr:hypothetical protein CRE_07732 [Caenorhabditis remanei]
MFFLLVSLAIFTYYFYHWTYWKRRGVPGPWGLPIFGKSGIMLDDRVAPSLIIQKWTQKYGKIYGFTEGMQKVMVISDPNSVQELFVKQFDNFYGRRLNPVQGDPDKDEGVHIVAAQGFRFCQEYTMDVIMRIAMGQPYSRMFNNPILYDCEGFFEKNRWQIWMFGSAFPFAIQIIKYIFLKLGKFGAGPFIRIQKTVTDAVMARIAQREADKKNGIEPGEPQDFIDLFLDARVDNVEHFGETNDEFHKKTSYNNRQLTTAEIISQCFIFLIAGFDTTAISLSYVAYFLALHPEVQQKLQKEIDKECHDSEITVDQLSKLKYMENTIKEALRLHPLAAFVNSRQCMRTTKLGNHVVEAGVDVLVDTWSLHYNKEIWGEDADKFKPVRLVRVPSKSLTDSRWESPLNPHQAFLSFGAGPRQCLGMRLAYLEQKSLLAHVLRKYSFVPNMKTQIPMKLVGRQTSRPESLILTLKARD